MKLHSDKSKETVLKVFLVASIIPCLVFAVLNIQRENYSLAGLEIFMSLFSVALLYWIKSHKKSLNFEYLSLFYVLFFCGFLIHTFASGKTSDTVFIWTLAIPMIAYLMLGVKKGFVITLIFYSITTWLFWDRFTNHPLLPETVSFANIFFCALLFWVLSHTYEYSSQLSSNQLREMAVLDHLTGLYNRNLLTQTYQDKSSKSLQQNQAVGIILFDLDHFKSINDEHGHNAGDKVLVEFSMIIRQVFTSRGTAFRIGGEEFLVLISLEEAKMASKLAEQVRKRTLKMNIEGIPTLSISVSAGIATTNKPGLTFSDLMKSADDQLYLAKQAGRNRVAATDENLG